MFLTETVHLYHAEKKNATCEIKMVEKRESPESELITLLKSQRCDMYFRKTNQTQKVNIYTINKVIIQTQKWLFDTFPHKLPALEWNEVPKTLFYLIEIST